MPQTDDFTRDKIRNIFGTINFHGPLRILKELGWTEKDRWLNPPQEYTDFERLLVKFLVEEWNYAIVRHGEMHRRVR